MTVTFPVWCKHYQQQALLLGERRLVVIEGSIKKSVDYLSTFDSFNQQALGGKSSRLWHIYSDSVELSGNITKQNYRHHLGTESHYVVFNDSEFSIDVLAALSGTLVAGGILFILLPANTLTTPRVQPPLFLRRFFQQLKKFPQHVFIKEGDSFELSAKESMETSREETSPLITSSVPRLPWLCATDEQYHAACAIIQVAQGRRDRPLVLTADRGRGKSSALAIACSQLVALESTFSENTIAKNTLAQHIIITAPHRQSLDVFFKQLRTSLPGGEFSHNKMIYQHHIIEFMPLDMLLKNKPVVSLILVDEAAALPVYMLAEVLSHYHRCIFSSTVHGYEGAGRGFTIKFQQLLHNKYPNYKKLHINQAIRWSDKDPLEKFIFDACLLNASLTDETLAVKTFINDDKKVKKLFENRLSTKILTVQALASNEDLLAQVFSILVTAHYQTKPSDLKLLLDNPNIHVLAIFNYEQVIAVTLLMAEGNIENDITSKSGMNEENIQAIKKSKRRFKNQFLPQSLLTHCGAMDAFNYRYLRVLRIAVHPQFQGLGIGKHLLNEINIYAQEQGFHYVGASFGVHQALLSFWLSSGYKLVRIGFTQDSASGEHSALVLKQLNVSKASELLCNDDEMNNRLQQQFVRTFDYLLTDEYQTLAEPLISLILAQHPRHYLPLFTPQDEDTVLAYINKERLYSSCVYSLHQWFLHHMIHTATEGLHCEKQSDAHPLSQAIIISRLLKKQTVAEVCQRYALQGKKDLDKLVHSYVESHFTKV